MASDAAGAEPVTELSSSTPSRTWSRSSTRSVVSTTPGCHGIASRSCPLSRPGAMTTTRTWNDRLVEQIDCHWTPPLRPRLEGLTDEEYLWEPVPSWNVRPRGPHRGRPASVGVHRHRARYPRARPGPVHHHRLAARPHDRRGPRHAQRQPLRRAGGPTSPGTTRRRPTEALGPARRGYAGWIAGVRGLGDEGLEQPCGPAEGAGTARSRWPTLVLHINRELIHHGAEICLLRDLYLHTDGRSL